MHYLPGCTTCLHHTPLYQALASKATFPEKIGGSASAGRRDGLSAMAMAVAASALQQARAERVEVKEAVTRQLRDASLR